MCGKQMWMKATGLSERTLRKCVVNKGGWRRQG